MDIKELKEKFRLTTNDEESIIYVVPIDKYSYTTYPIEDLSKSLALTLEDFIKLRFNLLCFSDDLKSLVDFEEVEEEEI